MWLFLPLELWLILLSLNFLKTRRWKEMLHFNIKKTSSSIWATMPLHLSLRGGVLFFSSTSLWSQQAQSILLWILWDLGARSYSNCHYFNSLLKFYSGLKWDKKIPGSGFMSLFTCCLFCWALKIQYWSWGTEGYYLCLYLFILNFH